MENKPILVEVYTQWADVFKLFMKYKVDTRYTIVQQFLLYIHYSNSSLVIPPGTAYTYHKHLCSTSVCHHKCISIVGYSYARNTWIQTFDTWLLCTSHTNKIDTMSNTATYVWVRGSSSLVPGTTYILYSRYEFLVNSQFTMRTPRRVGIGCYVVWRHTVTLLARVCSRWISIMSACV